MSSTNASSSNSGSKVSLLVKPLEDASEYNTWSYILRGHFELEDATSEILNGEVVISQSEDGQLLVTSMSVTPGVDESYRDPPPVQQIQ